jgi:hypothetical protein
MPSKRRGSLLKAMTQLDLEIRRSLFRSCIGTASIFKRTQDTVIQNWSIDIGFELKPTVVPNSIEIFMHVTGKDAAIWTYIDEGTGIFGPKRQKYVIAPRGDYPLRFQTGYAPRTNPIGKFGGPGKKFGNWVSVPYVIHPGITPRLFTVSTSRALKPVFLRSLINGINRIIS